MLWIRCCRLRQSSLMGKNKGEEAQKLSFWETIRSAEGPYGRLYRYVKPYKWRFILGLLFGLALWRLIRFCRWSWCRCRASSFMARFRTQNRFCKHREMLTAGPQINSIRVRLPRHSAGHDGAQPFFLRQRLLHELGQQPGRDGHSERAFSKMVRHSMDFFNKIRAGFLMSRIANDTRSMQMALTTVSSDVFKQPVTIIGGIAVLFMMDWKFTVVTLVLFPTCLLPIRLFGKRARRAVQHEQKGMGQMTVTMQETFAGIRVIKSFAREEHQEKFFRRATQQQFSNAMRMVKSMEAVGPLVEIIASIGVGLALFYVYAANLPAGQFLGLIAGIFILYEPVKTLSKLHIVMQRSIGATTKIFALLDSSPTVQDAPDAVDLASSRGQIDFEHVTFRYATGVTDAVQDLHLRIEPGKTYALVGPSGAGKSTILSLILRLYDPTGARSGSMARICAS